MHVRTYVHHLQPRPKQTERTHSAFPAGQGRHVWAEMARYINESLNSIWIREFGKIMSNGTWNSSCNGLLAYSCSICWLHKFHKMAWFGSATLNGVQVDRGHLSYSGVKQIGSSLPDAASLVNQVEAKSHPEPLPSAPPFSQPLKRNDVASCYSLADRGAILLTRFNKPPN